ncbi:hypothetical protein [Candidatus Avelusimicrobium luingense]|uniref:hypothetical protein n=1 Tax=Candidatus Avelusimicrobium luingense TaxID=3416211 RepID=UPI003D0E8EE4
MRNFLSQINGWEVIVFLVCALILGAHFGRQIDFENMFKKDSPVPVHMGGSVRYAKNIANVQVVNIPQTVYDSLAQDTRFKRYLTGNHKYVLLFTYPGCPYSRAYKRAFDTLFSQRGFDEFYRKRIITVGRTTSVSCPGHQSMDCATAWIFQNCFGKLCILNPQRKQAVADSSQNAGQLADLLEKYREW